MSDDDRISPDGVVELAREYRDQMMKDLGVVGIASAAHRHVPGEEIRRLPVETTGAHDDVQTAIGHSRILTDVTNYDGDDDVAAHDDVRWMTVRETTGRAAIYSSATLGLGWHTMPTPREVRIAEFLEGLDDQDLDPEGWGERRETAAEGIMRLILPWDLTTDHVGLWTDVDDAPIGNVEALEHCPTAVEMIGTGRDGGLHLARYADADDDDNTVFSRWSWANLVVEYHTESRGAGKPSERWYEAYARDGDGWAEHDVEADGAGYATLTDDDGDELETTLWTIPELRHPAHVLDLPMPDPREPRAAQDQEGNDDA